VWREQGLGDEIFFATCVPDLVAAGGEVTLAASPRLVTLFARALPGVRVIEDGAWGAESFDYHAPIGGLPRYLRTRPTSFPAGGKLLVPRSDQATKWSERLQRLGPGSPVGICWRSGLLSAERSRQYSALDAWGPLFALPGVHWVNLQYDECEGELAAAEHRFGIRIHRWKREDLRDDLESVVGLLWSLDLVITAPTAVSSLAGAVGTRTWQVDAGGDWSAFGGASSPWLPAIRMVRRDAGERWDSVLERLARELALAMERESCAA
jgi:hypothetical protein